MNKETHTPKILFTDMDGTLLLSDRTVSPAMKETLNRLTEAGHKLVLTSGRPLDSILEVMEAAGLFYPGTLIISNNGSLIYDCSARSPLMEKTVPFPIVADIMSMADEMGIHSQTYTDHEIVCRQEDKEVIHYRERIHMPLITASDILSVLPRPPYKVHCIHLTDKDRLEALKGKVERKYAGQITAQFSNDQYLEFYSHEAGKGNAILEVCRIFGIPEENSIAAGDAPNDISMLLAAGTGVAMANADPDVKEAADFITSLDNDHNGLIQAIEKFILC